MKTYDFDNQSQIGPPLAIDCSSTTLDIHFLRSFLVYVAKSVGGYQLVMATILPSLLVESAGSWT